VGGADPALAVPIRLYPVQADDVGDDAGEEDGPHVGAVDGGKDGGGKGGRAGRERVHRDGDGVQHGLLAVAIGVVRLADDGEEAVAAVAGRVVGGQVKGIGPILNQPAAIDVRLPDGTVDGDGDDAHLPRRSNGVPLDGKAVGRGQHNAIGGGKDDGIEQPDADRL